MNSLIFLGIAEYFDKKSFKKMRFFFMKARTCRGNIQAFTCCGGSGVSFEKPNNVFRDILEFSGPGSQYQ